MTGRSAAGVVALLSLLAGLGASGACGGRRLAADVLLEGRFVTLEAEPPEAEAVAVRDGRIVAVGGRRELEARVGDGVARVELPGVALPGFAEAHGHAEGLGEQLEQLDLQRLSREEILERVAAAAAQAAPGAWIRGGGWDQGFWERPEFPTAADLDAVAADHPVVLTRIGGHSVWMNSRALELAGIDAATADPEGGRILRDGRGRPTGILVDAAADLAAAAVPAPTRRQREARLRAALDRYVGWGVTSLHDAGVDLETIAIYQELLAVGELPLRLYVMARGQGETAAHYLESGPEIDLGGRLTVRAFKLYLDGALGSRGAWLASPYADDPAETGLVLMQPDALADTIGRATEGGFQVAVHAIGDMAVRRALDAFAAAGAAAAHLRPRIEHVSVVNPADIPRFARLGVIASMQPVFVGEYSRWARQRLGGERIAWVYPTRRLLESGAVVASGTDYPASDTGDPILTLYSLVTRKGADGTPADGFLADERVSVDTALRTMTTGAAYAAFQERDLGTIAVGKLADMTVLSGDPRSTPAERLRELRVLATVVGGGVVRR